MADVQLNWCDDPAELAALWRWLEERGWRPDDPAYFMEKAHKWSAEREQMLSEERQPAPADCTEAVAEATP